MEWVTAYILHQKESTKKYKAGFYWVDETGDLNGPLDTVEQAQIELDAYVDWLEKGDK